MKTTQEIHNSAYDTGHKVGKSDGRKDTRDQAYKYLISLAELAYGKGRNEVAQALEYAAEEIYQESYGEKV